MKLKKLFKKSKYIYYKTKHTKYIIESIIALIIVLGSIKSFNIPEKLSNFFNNLKLNSINSVDTSSINSNKNNNVNSSEDISIENDLGNFYIEYFDIGQGDSILIWDDNGNSCLIDTGIYSKYDTLNAYLQSEGITDIDYLILTHPDADHIGSSDYIISDYDVENVIMPNVESDSKTYWYLTNALEENNITPIYAMSGMEFNLGNGLLSILAPESEADFTDTNSYSVIVKFIYGETSYLFTGDATGEETTMLLNSGYDLTADVYKVAHHGSANNGCNNEDFITAINPEYAVISCGLDNSYGHPHVETMDLLKEKNIKVFRTDKQGNIKSTTDGINIVWNVDCSTDYSSGGN